jgi:hypothetical protein
MKWLSKAAVGGLLWLAFSALAFGDQPSGNGFGKGSHKVVTM